jgi:hypothetical protein
MRVYVELWAPYTGVQNGTLNPHTIAIGAKPPDEPSVSHATVYLHNRTPKYTYNWS